MTEDYTTDSAAIKPHEELFAVFRCWYEGDSNLVEDSLVGIATSQESAIKMARTSAEREPDAIYMPGECIPDDGVYSDKRIRYKVDAIRINEVYEPTTSKRLW